MSQNVSHLLYTEEAISSTRSSQSEKKKTKPKIKCGEGRETIYFSK